MSDVWKLEFSEKGIKRCRKEELWLGSPKYIEVETIEYEKLNNIKLNMFVTKIEPKIDGGRIKKLIFDVSNFKLEPPTVSALQPEPLNKQTLVIGNERLPWRKSNDLLKNTAEWLFEHSRLQLKDLPVYVPGGRRYLLNSIPQHGYGRKFDGTPYKVSESLFLCTSFSSPDCKAHAEYLMKKFAPDIEFKILGFPIE